MSDCWIILGQYDTIRESLPLAIAFVDRLPDAPILSGSRKFHSRMKFVLFRKKTSV